MIDPREELTAALAAQAEAERRLHRAVQQARDAGWSWAEVAGALGVTRQAAHRRFHAAPAADPAPGREPWWRKAAATARRVAQAWFDDDLGAVHARMTSTARAALPQSALRRVRDELQDLAGECDRPEVTGLHDLDGTALLDGAVLREEAAHTDGGPDVQGGREEATGPGGRPRAVVVRLVAAGEQADPVIHVLVGAGGRVAGLSARVSDTLEAWPL